MAQDVYPGKFKPTISHAFLALLYRKELLKTLFTQNIDTLERRAGIPAEVIVEAHGSFASQSCVDCHAKFPDELMKIAIEASQPAHCLDLECGGLVKPDIIFFGEQLPQRFHEKCEGIARAGLVLVTGSSLLVAPFSSLPPMAAEGTPRVLFNRDRVGDLGTRVDDVVLLGDCDGNVMKLAEALGWGEDLERIWRECRNEASEEAVKAI